MDELKEDYEAEASDAVKMILCNYSGIDNVIEYGYVDENTPQPNLSEADLAAVNSHIWCEFHIKMDSQLDKLKRIKL
jgi:hypothetical protein